MKKININIFLLLIAFLAVNCGNFRIKKSKEERIFNSQEQELEYYYAFTEATKLSIFGNSKDAISLYNQCLKYNPKSAAVNYQLSNIYLSIGQLGMAKKYALKSNELEKNNKWFLLNLAAIYQLQRNIDSLIIVYEKIVDLDNKDIKNLFNLAILYKENKEYRKSLLIIKKITQISGLNERIIFFKHDVYDKKGAKRKAINEIKNGIIIFPDNIDLYGLLAEYYADINKNDMAGIIYKKILAMDSTNFKVLLSYADFLINNEKNVKAFKYYEKALLSDDLGINEKIMIIVNFIKNDWYFKNYSNEILFLMKKFKNLYNDDLRIRSLSVDVNIQGRDFLNASEDLKYVIRNNGKDYIEWERLLYIENTIGNIDSVLYYSNIAIEKFNDKPSAYMFNGLALMQKGDNRNAISTFKNGLEHAVDKNDRVQFYGYIAENFRNINENDSSDYYFEKVLLLDKENSIINNNYSYYLSLRNKNLEKAEKLSKLTIIKEPNNATYLDTYGWILFKMNKEKKALRYIEQAVRNSNFENAEILDHYGDILFNLFRWNDAVSAWNKALQIDSTRKEITKKIEDINQLLKK